jgi:hypothetical protein
MHAIHKENHFNDISQLSAIEKHTIRRIARLYTSYNQWKHKQLSAMQLSFTTCWVAWNTQYIKMIRLGYWAKTILCKYNEKYESPR